MKTPIVAVEDDGLYVWKLSKGIQLERSPKVSDVVVFMDDTIHGELSIKMAQELFNVILYPPGSEPSPESADPTGKARMRLIEEQAYDDDIPRIDIKGEG